MEYIVDDIHNIPSKGIDVMTKDILSEEKLIENRLRVIIRSRMDIESGLVRSWQGPRRDPIVML